MGDKGIVVTNGREGGLKDVHVVRPSRGVLGIEGGERRESIAALNSTVQVDQSKKEKVGAV